jgi:hypothetical protein
MKIFTIFEKRLYAFKFPNEDYDQFERLFDCWQDPEFLENFFTQHERDLRSNFYRTLSISVEDAVLYTIDEAKRLEKRLLYLSSDPRQSLSDVFKPLSDWDFGKYKSFKYKAYGSRRKSWLRIYAIRMAANIYIVTGGAIKLTQTMQDREHTATELRKMDRCIEFLREVGVDDIEGFKELDL